MNAYDPADEEPTRRWRRPWSEWQLIAFLIAMALGFACTVRWWP